MAINSTNINKTNNHLSPKVSLNSDGHQFHQYEENEQSHLQFHSLSTKRPRHMTLEIQVLEGNLVNGIPTLRS
jgi:hypothetical protein